MKDEARKQHQITVSLLKEIKIKSAKPGTIKLKQTTAMAPHPSAPKVVSPKPPVIQRPSSKPVETGTTKARQRNTTEYKR
jgi:hypothetical protein